ncbi:MAG: hypothetical protein RMN52_10905 [Anaerolineae bacterium]|nr:hypothetical protein [Candidatus Roseilinea sp.]MDW8450502.1 hypothetical protein [Anaerolineae bacterium]
MSSLRGRLRRAAALVALVIAFATGSLAVAQSGESLARIVTPVRDQTLRGNVTIQGSAISPVFSRYELAYAQEPDLANWIVIGGAVQPVQSGMLGVWNTRPLPDGKYALRLQVFGTDGSLNETIVRNLTLANADTSPTPAVAAVITDTTATGVGVVAEVQTARNLLQIAIATIAQFPDAFMRGARLAILGFLAFGAYLVLKKAVLFAIQRLTQRPMDYGK